MAVRLTFDGQKRAWSGIGGLKATAGLPDKQHTEDIIQFQGMC